MDGLLFARWKELSPEEVPDGCPSDHNLFTATNFHLRPIERVHAHTARLDTALDFLERMENWVQLRIWDRKTDDPAIILNKNPMTYEGVRGFTRKVIDQRTDNEGQPVWVPSCSLIVLNCDFVLALLRNDLTANERLVHQFYVAKTVCPHLRQT